MTGVGVPEAGGSAGLARVKDVLRDLIAQTAGFPRELIDDDASFEGELAMDSLSFVNLQVEIERTFEIDCTLDELRAVEPRFEAVAAFVASKVQEAGE